MERFTDEGRSKLNGARTDIETLRDCLSIMRDMEFAKLDGKTKSAIERYAIETMDAILRPLYPKGEKESTAKA